VTEVDRRPPRHCIKCGRLIGPDETICEVCNRAGMATPSATQYHGTIVVAIVAGVVIMAIAASLAIRGIGPFRGEALHWAADPPAGVLVEVQVSNEGTQGGRAKCELTAVDTSNRVLGVKATISPQVPRGGTITFEERIPGMPALPASVAVSCH
jgi:RNA polymerase subunit RPABC4/transcription elongation factor Spt4